MPKDTCPARHQTIQICLYQAAEIRPRPRPHGHNLFKPYAAADPAPELDVLSSESFENKG